VDKRDLEHVVEREKKLGYTGFIFRGNGQPGNDTPAALALRRSQLLQADLETLGKIEKLMQTNFKTGGHSYWLKHRVEEAIGEYVSNGELIAVCLHLGFSYLSDGPNCRLFYEGACRPRRRLT